MGLYDHEADETERARYRLALQLPLAQENGDLALRYEPLHGLASNTVVGVQAVLTWYDPKTGVPKDISHEECLELAALSGLVRTLGPWMLREGCIQLSHWRAALGAAAPRLRVDLTHHLARDPDLVKTVRQALEMTVTAPSDLRLGVPVSALVESGGDAESNIMALRDNEIQVVLLDASGAPDYLQYLENLGITVAELSPRTVQGLAERADPHSLIARGVLDRIEQARTLGVLTIAAGIDTAEHLAWWRQAKVDSCRGRYYGQPLLPDELVDLLRNDSAH